MYTFQETAACCIEDDGLLFGFWDPGGCECATMSLCQHLTLANFAKSSRRCGSLEHELLLLLLLVLLLPLFLYCSSFRWRGRVARSITCPQHLQSETVSSFRASVQRGLWCSAPTRRRQHVVALRSEEELVAEAHRYASVRNETGLRTRPTP